MAARIIPVDRVLSSVPIPVQLQRVLEVVPSLVLAEEPPLRAIIIPRSQAVKPGCLVELLTLVAVGVRGRRYAARAQAAVCVVLVAVSGQVAAAASQAADVAQAVG